MHTKPSLDNVSARMGQGNIDAQYQMLLGGINHMISATVAPMMDNSNGLILFQRPDFNMSDANLRSFRLATPYLTEDRISIPYYIRALMDPRGNEHCGVHRRAVTGNSRSLSTPLLNAKSAFIDVFTNSCDSLTGWPDIELSVAVSEPGQIKEQTIQYDYHSTNYESITLTGEFKNFRGGIITAITRAIWIYCGNVKSGVFWPYPINGLNHRLDYFTRIWRIVMDGNTDRIANLASTRALIGAYPVGAGLNYSRATPVGEDSTTVSIPFTCSGFEVDDPILVYEFNWAVAMFNPSMAIDEAELINILASDDSVHAVDVERKMLEQNGMTCINGVDKILFNYRGYPRITVDQRLTWWVPVEEYDLKIAMYD